MLHDLALWYSHDGYAEIFCCKVYFFFVREFYSFISAFNLMNKTHYAFQVGDGNSL